MDKQIPSTIILARRSQEETGGARTSQEEPGQEKPEGAKRSQEEPGGHRREPAEARLSFPVSSWLLLNSWPIKKWQRINIPGLKRARGGHSKALLKLIRLLLSP